MLTVPYRKIENVLPENSGNAWGFGKKPFADDKDREQFVRTLM